MLDVVHQPLLDIRDLTVEFATRRGTVTAVRNIDISANKGETLGIVGESGSGKSVTSFAVMRILDRAGRIAGGSVTFSGIDLRAASDRDMGDMRGREISMIFQNPRAALNPIRTVGKQIADMLRPSMGEQIPSDPKEIARAFGMGWWKTDSQAAQELLEKSGFSKRGGAWFTPQG